MKSLEFHFLEEDRQLIFGCDFVEVEIVSIPVDYFMAYGFIFDLLDSASIALNDFDLTVA